MSIFESVFYMLPHPMAVVRWREGRPSFDHANDAFVQLTGLPPEALRATPPARLFTSWSGEEAFGPKAAGGDSCDLKPPSSAQTVRLRLTWKPIGREGEQPAQLLIAEDISAKAWIDEMAKTKDILFSGIVDADFTIHRFEQKYPVKMLDMPVEHESALDFFHEEERRSIERMMKRITAGKQPESFTVRTKTLADSLQLELQSIVCPFFHGDGSLKQHAFIVTGVRPVSESTAPSVMLRVLMAKQGISARQLSEATGISLQTISKLRNGKIKKPQRLTAELVAAELNVSPSEIWST